MTRITDTNRKLENIDRRSFLKAAGAVTALTAGTAGALASIGNVPSPSPTPTNDSSQSVGVQTASTLDELVEGLSHTSRGDVIFLQTDTSIDVGSTELVVPTGVTLAGRKGESGLPTLSTDIEYSSMVHLGRNSRITGVRFDGPNWGVNGTEDDPEGECINASEPGAAIDNCELFGFSYASVNAKANVHIHHCDIHHNLRNGLGYGIVVNSDHPLIERNRFNYNRHAIDCDGGPSMGYEARYNHFGPDTLEYVVGTHEPGGERFEVHHNTFEPPTRVVDGDPKAAIRVRGTPADVYAITHNWFRRDVRPRQSEPYATSEQPIAQTDHGSNTFENVVWNDNHYGPNDPPPDAGVPNGRIGLGAQSESPLNQSTSFPPRL